MANPVGPYAPNDGYSNNLNLIVMRLGGSVAVYTQLPTDNFNIGDKVATYVIRDHPADKINTMTVNEPSTTGVVNRR
jgi:hypothetical protein